MEMGIPSHGASSKRLSRLSLQKKKLQLPLLVAVPSVLSVAALEVPVLCCKHECRSPSPFKPDLIDEFTIARMHLRGSK